MEIKVGVSGKMGQSFDLFKNNFLGLFLPFFLYNFISVVIVGTISEYYMMSSLSGIDNVNDLDLFGFLNDSTVVIGIVIGVTLFIIYLLLYVVILLGFLKSVRQAVKGDKISIFSNIIYGITNFNNSMKTYWYIFAYIALLPSILFIIGGVLFNLSYFLSSGDILINIGGLFIIFSLILFIVFSVYRGVKSKFALYSAVNGNSFTKDNFNESIIYTNNNWLRIIGNFLYVGFIVSIVIYIISSLFGIILFSILDSNSLINDIINYFISGINISNANNASIIIMDKIKNFNIGIFMNIMDNYVTNFSITSEIISKTVENIFKTISSVYLLIFTYIFFLGIKEESNTQIIELKDM